MRSVRFEVRVYMVLCLYAILSSIFMYLSSKDVHTTLESIVEEMKPTVAIQKELEKHDRYIIESQAFMSKFTARGAWYPDIRRKPSICINIFAYQHPLPYLDALLTGFVRGQHLKRLTDTAHINVLHLDQVRPRKLKKFKFIDSIGLSSAKDPLITAMHLCIDAEMSWCLLLQQATMVPVDFIESLTTFFFKALQPDTLKNVAYISLYERFPFNLSRNDSMDVYEKDRGIGNKERSIRRMRPYVSNYTMHPLEYLERSRAILLPATSFHPLFTLARTHRNLNLVELLQRLEKDFRKKPLQLSPSLVNHIGFYDITGHLIQDFDTDIRFLVDPA